MSCHDGCVRRTRWRAWLVLGLLSAWSSARAAAAQDQFVAADETYTATTSNTMNSHYQMMPQPGIPTNWTSPIDYTQGTVYVKMDVLEKPSDQKTLVNLCFEGNTETCMAYPPAFTGTGSFTYHEQPGTFWQFAMYDWTKPPSSVAVSLKNGNGDLVQGDAMFYPTKMHVTVTVVAPGKTYVPPDNADAGVPRDAGAQAGRGGSAGAAGRSMLPSGAGRGSSAGAGGRANAGAPAAGTAAAVAGMDQPAAGTTAAAGRDQSSAGKAAGMAGTSAAADGGSAGAAPPKVSDYLESNAGCSAARIGEARGLPAWALALCAVAVLFRRRPRRRC